MNKDQMRDRRKERGRVEKKKPVRLHVATSCRASGVVMVTVASGGGCRSGRSVV